MQVDPVDKLKQAHKLRANLNVSPDPLAFLSQPTTTSTAFGVKDKPALDQVKVIVDEDGSTIVGNYKLGN